MEGGAKKRCFFRLAVVAVWVLTGPIGALAKEEASDFAFFVGIDRPESSKPCLLGKFEAGIKLNIFHSGSEKPCPAKTSGRDVGSPEGGLEDDADFTEVTGACATKAKIGVALLGEPVIDYSAIPIREIEDPIRIDEIDKAVRGSGVLETLRKQNQDLRPGELRELNGILPKVQQIGQPGADIQIVTYNREQPTTGSAYIPPANPRVIIINGTPYPLTGWCSFDTYHVFSLNKRLYFQSGSGCCGCGIVGFELFEITNRGPKVFLSDYSLST